MTPAAAKHLKKVDKKIGGLIKKLGNIKLETKKKTSPFESLVESIIYQQLNGKAAKTIFERMKGLFPKGRFPKPEAFLKMSDKKFRSAGVSGSKTAAIKDLALKTKEGLVPSQKQIEKLSDDEIVERLTSVRGIGRWTVEMLLIFKLGRRDVLPATDFAIRKAFGNIYSNAEMPAPKAVLTYGELWKPYRTFASLYLWKSLDKK